MSSLTGSNQPLTAFVAMCFDKRLEHVYIKVAKPVLENYGFDCTRADELTLSGIIMEQVLEEIEKSDLILCDLTYENPNVFYELGMAHLLKKNTIMISQSAANLPFDVRHWRILPYQDTKIGLLDLRDKLFETLQKSFPGGRSGDIPKKKITFDFDELEIQQSNLFSNSIDIKRFAIKFLGDCSDKSSFEKIKMIAINDDNIDVARDAFTSLYKIDPAKALPVLLNEGLRYQSNLYIRERVVTLLGNYPPDDKLFNQMRMQAGDSSWGVRRSVCEVFGRWGKKEAAGLLQEMLADSESQVRLAASEAIEQLYLAEQKKQAK